MAGEVIRLDTVDGAEIDLSKGVKRAVRGAIATNLDVSDPAEVLMKLQNHPDLPGTGTPLSKNYRNLLFSRLVVRAVRGKIAILRLVYEDISLQQGGGPVFETFAVEDVTTLGNGTTQISPIDKKQLRVSLTGTETEADLAAGETATLSYPLPMRSLVLYGLFSSRPSINVQKAVRTVNNGFWMGLEKGYWFFSGIRVRWSSLDERFAVSATVTTKGEEDWSSYGAVRGPDGKYIRVPDTEVSIMRTLGYQEGISRRTYGVIKVGLFRMTNFTNLFGIS